MFEKIDTIDNEKTLKNIEIRSKDWLENSPVCTKVVDTNFNLKYMSKAGVDALKIENINAYYGKSFPLDFYPEEFRQSMCKKLQDSKDTGEVRIHEGMIKTSDKKELWFESTVSPIYDSEGKLDYFMVVSIEISKRKQAEAKDILLKEIHHRIKNNLQIVSSILSLQVAEINDPEFKRTIANAKQRISAISLVHEKMYESNISGEIYVQPYIQELVSNISTTFLKDKGQFQQDIQIDNFKLNMDVLVPCSLILNEILTNIFKYGFISNPNPHLTIHVRKHRNEITIIIADNGSGIIENEKDKKKESLGMKLIKALAQQIKGTIDINSLENQGVCYTLKFNL